MTTCTHGQLARQCPICERDAEIAQLKAERDEARTTLAHTDIGSLPNDWTLQMVAEARIDDLIKLRDQVRDTCSRAEQAERDRARLAAENAKQRELLGDWLEGYDHDAEGEKTEVVKMLVAKDGSLVKATRAALGEEG